MQNNSSTNNSSNGTNTNQLSSIKEAYNTSYSSGVGSSGYSSSATNVNTQNQFNSCYGSYDENCASVIKIEPQQPLLISNSGVINQDPDPIRIVKPNTQNIVYKQQVNIRYLQPPTPPPPAPIIIREKQLAPLPSQPPIIIRQTAPAPPTPPPLTIREKAPTPPPIVEPTIIERPIPPPPPPPRQVIIERVPAPPAKPRPIIYEKWLPYKSTKRPIIVQKVKPSPPQPQPKNVIIEYEKPKAVAIRQVIEEGIFRVDPTTYQCTSINNGEIRFVDRITDLPIENSKILAQLNLETSINNQDTFNASNLYAQFIGSSSNSNHANKNHQNKNANNLGTSAPNLLDSTQFYSSISPNSQYYNNSNSHNLNVEYETITTSVPESLAVKIIAEARAAGAIARSGENSSTSFNC